MCFVIREKKKQLTQIKHVSQFFGVEMKLMYY